MGATTFVHSLLGIVLGLFLVFRVNSAYDRWWEGRVMWGKLVNDSRNFAHKLRSILSRDSEDERLFFLRNISLYAECLKEHLRREPDFESIQIEKNKEKEMFLKSQNKPNYVIGLIYTRVNLLRERSLIDGFQFLDLQNNLNGMVDVLGACERIRDSPIPYSYSMFIKKFIFLFLSTLPFGILGEYGYWTIPIVILLLYILMGTELIAEEIEDPFGTDVNDLPTDELAKKVGTNVSNILTRLG